MQDLLHAAISSQQDVRQAAEEELKRRSTAQPEAYLVELMGVLASEESPPDMRQLAGLQLKNNFTAKDPQRRQELGQSWMGLSPTTRNQVKQQLVQVFNSPLREARNVAAYACATIATIEMPMGEWKDLVDNLLIGLQPGSPLPVREASLTCLGMLCEDPDPPEVLKAGANRILDALVGTNGVLQKQEKELEVRKLAATTMLNLLDLIKENFEREADRDVIMQALCECTQKENAPDESLRATAMESLARVALLYYDHLDKYIKPLYEITTNSVNIDSEKVGLQGIEFWNTICEVEIDLAETGMNSKFYVRAALEALVSLLTSHLVHKGEDEDDDDEWNLHASASVCLGLVSSNVRDEVVGKMTNFFGANFPSPDWRQREAAALAFGYIMHGPSTQSLADIINTGLQYLTSDPFIKDPKPLLRDTTMFTLARIAEFHGDLLLNNVAAILPKVKELLGDEPRVAAKACFFLLHLCDHISAAHTKANAIPRSSCLTPEYMSLVQMLTQAGDRPDANTSNLRHSAYDALNSLIDAATQEDMEVVANLVPYLLTKLQEAMQQGGNMGSVQGLLCGSLQDCTKKLQRQIATHANGMMEAYMQVFNVPSAAVHSEVLMAVGALAVVLEGDFAVAMPNFLPALKQCLQNINESQVLTSAVGCVGDVVAALGSGFHIASGELVPILLSHLNNSEVPTELKPEIIALLGDIALAIGTPFGPHLEGVMNVLHLAGSIQVTRQTEADEIEDVTRLKSAICRAYSSIFLGLANHKEELAKYAERVLDFARRMANEDILQPTIKQDGHQLISDITTASSC